MSLFSFRKNEILRSRKRSASLFKDGSSFYIFPYRIFWMLTTLDEETPAQVMFSVGKRSFRKAVDRNLVRRRTRESYRLQKHDFYRFLEDNGQQCILAFVYTARVPLSLADTQRKIFAIFTRLNQEITKKLNSKISII
jgi:ribonuclease P protein component